jgi:putative solute:sodium symporter small subunit
MAQISAEAKQRHWERTRNLTVIVLVTWFVFSFVLPWFAGPLNAASFLGFPLGYYFCVQGSLIVFVLLIFFQNWRQDAIDNDAGVGGE